MKRTLLVLSLLATPVAAWGAQAPALDLTPGPNGVIRCAAPRVSNEEAAAVQSKVVRARGAQGSSPISATIPVAFHVITCGAEGNVPQSQIDAQIRELNRAYRGTGFSFRLASVDRTDDCQWFNNLTGPGVEKKAKQALAIDPAHRLNVYSANLGHAFLGWAYFPQSFPESDPMHGVVIHYGSLPGGFLAPYNLGGTLDHETGHYLGLFHTFQGGCTAPGDFVDDTPFEASPAGGCPEGRNTCPQPGDDPIHNYMDYTDDACLTEFSSGQAARMQAIVPAYRPGLFAGATASGPRRTDSRLAIGDAAVELAFRGAAPNPFSRATTLRFALPRSGHVALELYDLAGERVAVLVDGESAAGEHSVEVRADRLAPGMYYASLRYEGRTATRSVVVVR